MNDSILWHAILGYVQYKRMQDMSKDGLIPAFDMDTEKIELCDLHATSSLGNKKYFVTFIDDASRAVVRLTDLKPKTLGERGIKCIFVGYAEHSKDFRFYLIEPNESVSVNSIIESRDVIFDKNRFSLVLRPSLRISNEIKDIGGLVIPEEVTEEVVTQQPKPETRKGKQNRTPKNFGPKFQLYLIEGTRYEVSDQHSYCFNVEDDPKTFDEAINIIRLLIALALIHSLIIHQVNVKTTFLNGELDEEVYMNQSHDFIMPGNENKVCKLIKSLHGLKQAPKFSMKDMGEADIILSIRIKYESNGIAISQSHYINKVPKKFNYFDCTPVSTPMDTSEKLMPNSDQAVSQLKYSRVIGCLMYAMTYIRPDIVFVVGKLSRYTSNPGTQHWQAIQRNTKDNSSTSGWVFLLDGGVISWAFKKQTCITSSTMKYEFVALVTAGKETEWLKNLILEIPLWSKPVSPISILCDSATTLARLIGEGSTIPVESHHTPISTSSTSQPPTSPPSIQTTYVAEEAATMPHDSPLPRFHSLGSDEGSMTLNELTVLCTTLSKKVETLESDLKQTKLTYGVAYTKLIMKVKKLEHKLKSSKARRRVRLVISDDEDNQEDPSKQGRKIAQIDEDEGITLVQMSTQTQGRHEHDFKEPDFEFIALEEDYTAEPDISTANVPISTVGAEVSTASPEVKTDTESLVYIRRSASKRKDKGKAIMKEAEPVQKKTKLQLEQERLGLEEALRLQEQLDEEERQRIARVHEEASTFNAEEWDNIQAQIEADEELAHRLQAQERERYSEADKARLLVELINERKRKFAQQRAEQRRNKPMTQAQQRTYMCNYIKHMGSHTLQQLKKLSFDEVKELFETTMKRVNTFTPMESDDTVPKVVAGSSKIDAEQELNQESSKRQKIGEGSEPAEESKDELSQEQLQQLMIIVPEEGMNVEALQTKYPIIDWEVYTEDSRKYWKIIRVGNHTEVELKRLFEPDDDDTLWKLQRYMHNPLKWRLYDTCVVHHVSTERGHDIFMLVEKNYPLTRALMTLMLSNKLQVDEYSWWLWRWIVVPDHGSCGVKQWWMWAWCQVVVVGVSNCEIMEVQVVRSGKMNYFGDAAGFDRSAVGSSSSRKGKKSHPDKPKQPQRGLGVAQLEKIRLHNQLGLHPTNHHPQEDIRIQTAYSPSSSFSYNSSSPSYNTSQGQQNIMACADSDMGMSEAERSNMIYGRAHHSSDPRDAYFMFVGIDAGAGSKCGERSRAHWWRRVEKVVVERRRCGGVMVVEKVEWKMKKKRLNHWVKGVDFVKNKV
ncbi:zinc finger, CCHC-type containing protein [Tanacetum coccineum]|uniref:Zinc finger, CCHC-type containing protein n=1 Tax=Tanacetum coccineum TaxID=301880 RepID=A0ABQ5G3A6_9ASTR